MEMTLGLRLLAVGLLLGAGALTFVGIQVITADMRKDEVEIPPPPYILVVALAMVGLALAVAGFIVGL